MIPVRDVVPSPTRPVVTVVLISASLVTTLIAESAAVSSRLPAPLVGAAATVSHGAWPLLAANGLLFWLLGPAIEDRTGPARFVLFCVATGIAGGIVPTAMGSGPAGAAALAIAAGAAAAHLVTFPDSRVLAIAPGRSGWTVVEWPSAVVAACWTLGPVADAIGILRLEPFGAPGVALAVAAAGSACGVLSMRVLRRPERFAVAWWDGPASAEVSSRRESAARAAPVR